MNILDQRQRNIELMQARERFLGLSEEGRDECVAKTIDKLRSLRNYSQLVEDTASILAANFGLRLLK